MITERLIPEREENPEIIRLHLARYEFVRQFVRGKSVLDVACGAGYGSAMLKEAGASKVVGVDVSTEAIAHARAHFQTSGLDFVVGNAENLSSHRGFEVVVSFETIEHLQNPETFLQEIARALAPQGLLIISTPQREQGTLQDKPRNQFHVREWTRTEFEELLAHSFDLENSFGQYGFEKWFPYSRTLQRFALKILFPQNFSAFDKYPVLVQPPEYKGFRLGLAYMVMICKAKKDCSANAR